MPAEFVRTLIHSVQFGVARILTNPATEKIRRVPALNVVARELDQQGSFMATVAAPNQKLAASMPATMPEVSTMPEALTTPEVSTTAEVSTSAASSPRVRLG